MRIAPVSLLLALLLSTTGCMTQIAAGSTIRVIRAGSPALGRFRDPDLAEGAIAGSVGTMEAVLVVKPESDVLHESLARAYSSLGFAFLMDHMEEALASDAENAEDLGEHYRVRASAAFLRAKELGLEQMTLWEDEGGGAEAAVARGIEAWTRYLEAFDDEEQVGVLFWGCYGWAQWVGLNKDDPNAVSDMPFITALAEHVLRLDPSYNAYAPHALRGGMLGNTPEQLGGRPQEAKEEFERAIAATERKNFMYLVLEARIVAVALQDRALFRSLLEEVLNGDVNAVLDWRLSNILAQRRAARYLGQIDELFIPEEPTPFEGAAAEPAGESAPAGAAAE